MSEPGAAMALPDRRVVVTALGLVQILAWGSTFYLLGVLGKPIAADTGWPYDWVIGGVSVGLAVAGMVSPRVGHLIGDRGGRPILAGAAILLALGLALLGAAQNFVWYLAAWVVIGAGMGAGLYDAAFSTLGGIYGSAARPAITSVTLFGGFASTVCWPLSAYLVEHLGWRGACFTYAALHIGVALPLMLFALPARAAALPHTGSANGEKPRVKLERSEWPVFALLAAVVTIGAATLSIIGMHLLTLLQARGLTLAAAVALGAIIGPAQVGARVVEMVVGRHYHPIWTMVAAAVLVAIGTGLLFTGLPVYALAVVFYGAGNGIGSVARGTLPLALFGPGRYAVLMGRLALPILVAMALSPYLAALALQGGGAELTLGLLAALAASNVVLVALLWSFSARARKGETG